MEVLKFVIFVTVQVLGTAAIKDTIKALEHLLINIKTPLTVSAFVCWEPGELDMNMSLIFSDKRTMFIEKLPFQISRFIS